MALTLAPLAVSWIALELAEPQRATSSASDLLHAQLLVDLGFTIASLASTDPLLWPASPARRWSHRGRSLATAALVAAVVTAVGTVLGATSSSSASALVATASCGLAVGTVSATLPGSPIVRVGAFLVGSIALRAWIEPLLAEHALQLADVVSLRPQGGSAFHGAISLLAPILGIFCAACCIDAARHPSR